MAAIGPQGGFSGGGAVLTAGWSGERPFPQPWIPASRDPWRGE